MRQVRIGFIGCGEIAALHRQAIERIAGARLARVFDREVDKAQALAARAGASVVGSVQEMLSDSSIDAVYVLTRHDSHAALVTQAVAAGKAVFCEKPLALTVADAEEVVRQVEMNSATVMVGLNYRWAPVIQQAKAWADAQPGRPLALHLSFVTSPFLQGWAGLEAEGGGVMHCLGSHAIDLAAHLLGCAFNEVTAVQSRLRLPEPYLPDTASVLLRGADGAIATLLLHDHAPAHYVQYETGEGSHLVRAELYGEGWVIVVDSLTHLTLYDAEGCREVDIPCDSRVERFGILAENAHFIECVRTGAQPRPDARDAAHVVALVQAAAASAQQGGALSAPGAVIVNRQEVSIDRT